MAIEIKNTISILLVEDDPLDAKMTLRALAETQLANHVTLVRDGEEALDYMYHRGKFQSREGGDPTLVLLDNKMPKIGGLEVLKALKNDELLRTIPVVAFTSSRLPQDLHDFYKHGVNAYVVKAMDYQKFVNSIKQLVVFWTEVNEPLPSAGEQK